MRVAQLGNMGMPCPPLEYGGTQRSMAQITSFQAAICGHQVTLYASADSAIIEHSAETARQLGLESKIEAAGDSIRLHTADEKTGSVTLRTTGQPSLGYRNPTASNTIENSSSCSCKMSDSIPTTSSTITTGDSRSTTSSPQACPARP
jgi:hypothetical protein